MIVYKYAVSVCDVRNKGNLENYRQKRAEWLSFLVGDEPHSISSQISTLSWDFCLFKTINELRRISVEQPTKSVGFNPYVSQMFDAGFFATQSLAIRRLTDAPNARAGRNVISLKRLISEIRTLRNIMTREVYVCNDGLPYDHALAEQTWFEQRHQSGTFNQRQYLPVQGAKAWQSSAELHEKFDFLSGVQATARSRDDLILPERLDDIETKLSACKDIRKLVDKFIAHAADLPSREELSEGETYTTLNKLHEAHKSIFQVAVFINNNILGAASFATNVPIPQDDHLVNLDKKWVQTAKLDFAHKIWDAEVALWEQAE